MSDWAGYHRPSKSGPKIPNSCRPGARMGCWEAWQSYDDGTKVVSKSERWHFCRPQANIGQGNGWALCTQKRRKDSWTLIVMFSTFIHQLPCTNKHRNAFSMIKCSSSGKPLHRGETDVSMLFQWEISTSPHWVKSNQLATSSYNVLKMTPFLKAENGIPVREAQLMANIGFRFGERFSLSYVLFLLAGLSWGELLSKRKIV